MDKNIAKEKNIELKSLIIEGKALVISDSVSSVQEGMQKLENYLKNNPSQNETAKAYLAIAKIRNGRISKSLIPELEKNRFRLPENWALMFCLSLAYADTGNTKKAKEALGLFWGLDTSKTSIYLELMKGFLFYHPDKFLSFVENIAKDSPDPSFQKACLMTLDTWEEYEKCLSVCEAMLKQENEMPKREKEQDYYLYKGLVAIKNKNLEEAKTYFQKVDSGFQTSDFHKDYWRWKHHVFICLMPQVFGINKRFQEIFKSQTLQELKEKTNELLTYYHKQCVERIINLRLPHTSHALKISSQHIIGWQFRTTFALARELDFSSEEKEPFHELVKEANKSRNVARKKIINACENFVTLLSRYKSFEEAKGHEKELLAELYVVTNEQINIYDLIADIKTHVTTEHQTTRTEIVKKIKEPPGRFWTNYRIAIRKGKNNDGELIVYDTYVSYRIELSKVQFNMMMLMAKNMTERDKDKSDAERGWTTTFKALSGGKMLSQHKRTEISRIRTKIVEESNKKLSPDLIESLPDKIKARKKSKVRIETPTDSPEKNTGYRISTPPENITIEH